MKLRVERMLKNLNKEEQETLLDDWAFWARPDQAPPDGDWTTWLILGGRGAGKTRAGAEWIRALVEGDAPNAAGAVGRVALVGETFHDVREVMIEGPSGLRTLAQKNWRPVYHTTRRRLEWPNGALGLVFSAEDPEGLRGAQFEAAWSDEIGKWREDEAAWANLQMGLRLGVRPRQAATTTPRATPLLRRLAKDKSVVVTRASTQANRAHLADAFLSQVLGAYEGTRLWRQEVLGEMIDDIEGALWTWEMLEAARVSDAPEMERVAVAVDPPASKGPHADECGIVVAGVARDSDGERIAYVLADRSGGGMSPLAWAARAVKAYRDLKADRIVVETNQGGEMATTVIAEVDRTVPVRAVRATRGKRTRAEPIAALYEQGRVRHVGVMPRLEDQMTAWTGAGDSPDRLDALVWALTELMLTGEGRPGVRRL